MPIIRKAHVVGKRVAAIALPKPPSSGPYASCTALLACSFSRNARMQTAKTGFTNAAYMGHMHSPAHLRPDPTCSSSAASSNANSERSSAVVT